MAFWDLVAMGEGLLRSEGEMEASVVSEATPLEDDEMLTTVGDLSLKDSFSTVNLVERFNSEVEGVFAGTGGVVLSLEPSLSLMGLLAGGDISSMETSRDLCLFLDSSCCCRICVSFRMESRTNK